jgi:hypothetical protein
MGMYLMSMHLMGLYLMGVHLMGVHIVECLSSSKGNPASRDHVRL